MFEILPIDSPSVSTSVLVAVLTWLVYQAAVLWFRYRGWVEVYDRLPRRKKRHWFWGHMDAHPGPSEEGIRYQLGFTREFPRFHAIWFGRLRCVIIVHHPETMKEILRASAHVAPKPRSQGTAYNVGIPWLGEGLLISNGNKWARNRRLLTPAFHFDMLKSYLTVKNACTDILLKKLDKFADSGEAFEAFNHVGLCSLDIITQCAFSYHSHCQVQGERNSYVHAVRRLSELWVDRSLNVLQAFDWVYFNLTSAGKEFSRLCDYVHSVSEDIIEKRRQVMKQQPGSSERTCRDFLDIILTAKDEDGKGLTHLEVRNEVDTFLFEGHDTTTSAMSFILLALAQNPDIQEKCRTEIDNILGDRDSDEIQYQDLSKMEYLTQCIKEALRMYTPVFFISRQMTEEFSLDGHHIPAGTVVGLDIYNLHHNAAVWGEDHDQFRPERFATVGPEKMDPFAFLPFSAGSRNCIGQNFAMHELKIIISRIVHRFEVTLKEGQNIEKQLAVVMRTKSGIWLHVKKRKHL